MIFCGLLSAVMLETGFKHFEARSNSKRYFLHAFLSGLSFAASYLVKASGVPSTGLLLLMAAAMNFGVLRKMSRRAFCFLSIAFLSPILLTQIFFLIKISDKRVTDELAV